ncbi:MAG TPA: hypothetical protein VGK02_10070 [Candidatus Aquicultor sp.]|jgi:hypothetical protein
MSDAHDGRIEGDMQNTETQVEQVEANSPSEERHGKNNTWRHVALYAAAWIAVVALFFVVNAGIRSSAVSREQRAQQQSGYTVANQITGDYSYDGQPVAQGSGAQTATPGTGGCDSGGCGAASRPSGSGGTAGCCGGKGAAGSTGTSVTPADAKQLQNIAIQWYAKQYGDANVTADVKDYGCHQQINIIKDGKVVKELKYQNGQLTQLTPW